MLAKNELSLEQLHLVQEELEVYFLKAQDLEGKPSQSLHETLQAAGDKQARKSATFKTKLESLKGKKTAEG